MIRRLGKLYYKLKGFYPVRIGEHSFKGTQEHAFFWRIVNRGGFEPEYFNILEK